MLLLRLWLSAVAVTIVSSVAFVLTVAVVLAIAVFNDSVLMKLYT